MTEIEVPYRAINPPEAVFNFRDKVRGIRDRNWVTLRKVYQTGNRKKLRRVRNTYFRNEMNRAAYLYEAGLRFPNVQEWKTEVAFFDPFMPIDHVIDWWRQPKKNGGFRYICDLSARMKAAHLMNADVIRAQMETPCFIYNVKRSDAPADGSGRDALVRKLLAQLSLGFGHYRIYDVRDCFNSVNPEVLESLPLQRRIYENTTKLENLCFRHNTEIERKLFTDNHTNRDIINDEEASGPEGLLQGSPSSNVALAYLLQDIPQPDPEDGCILLYGDDLIALSRSPMIADRVDQAIVQFFGQPNLGPLHLHRRASGYLGHFEYLGYEFSYSEIAGDWEVGLSAQNWEKLQSCRNEEALKHWPMTGLRVNFLIQRKIMSSLSGHIALSDPESLCDAFLFGGWDDTELATMARRRASRKMTREKSDFFS